MGKGNSKVAPVGAHAAALFAELDVDKKKNLSMTELSKAAATHGKEIEAAWPNDRIVEALQRHDANKDGKLNLKEFKRAIKELYAVDSGIIVRKIRRRSKKLRMIMRLAPRPPPFFPYSGTAAERNVVSEVLDGRLYLTNFRGAANYQEVIQRCKISHILSVGEEFAGDTPLAADGVTYWQTNVTDDEEQADVLKEALSSAVGQIRDALARKGDRVLVHCAAGISRSTTVVLAYLMEHEGFTLRDAFRHTLRRRRVVWPNNGFMAMLCKLEQDRSGGKTSTIDMADFARWGEFDEDAYLAARKVDREAPEEKQARLERQTSQHARRRSSEIEG